MKNWKRTTLGRTGLEVGRLGMSGGYGVPAAAVEEAFEKGVSYLYHGSIRRGGFAQALRNLKPKRQEWVLVVQSYTRVAGLMPWSLDRALRSVDSDYADVLLLGLWNKPLPERILDTARELREKGKVRHLAVSCHNRPQIPNFAQQDVFEILHVRYNAVHPGAEQEVFPKLPPGGARQGVVTFTTTSWGQLLKSSKIPKRERRPTATDCYRFAMSHPDVDLCMCGPADRVQAAEALKALESGPLTAEELDWMRRVGKAIHGN